MNDGKRKVNDMTLTFDIEIKDLERNLPNVNRVALSNLRHSKDWLPLLSKYKMVEVISGAETIAMLNDPQLITDLIETVKEQQLELEQLRIHALYAERLKYTDELKAASDAKEETMLYLNELLDTREG